jgi:hypothetical protein
MDPVKAGAGSCAQSASTDLVGSSTADARLDE